MNDKKPNETRWWWIRHAPVPDTVRIYGQTDVDCDCSSQAVFAARDRTRFPFWFGPAEEVCLFAPILIFRREPWVWVFWTAALGSRPD